MDNEKLVKTIRNMCKEHNISVSQLEKELNFGAGLISRWVKTDPSLSKIVEIADYFHLSLDKVVGRDDWFNDEFLNAIIKVVEDKVLEWHSTRSKPNEYVLPIYRGGYGDYSIDEDAEDEITYYTEYDEGFIILYSYFAIQKKLNPIELILYIQPGKQTKIVRQQYSTNELMPLYLKILNNLHEEMPDEIKAEEFKNAFVLNKSLINGNDVLSGGLNDKPEKEILTKVANDPAVRQFMELCRKPEFQEMQQVMTSPEFKAAIEAANKIKKQLNVEGK